MASWNVGLSAAALLLSYWGASYAAEAHLAASVRYGAIGVAILCVGWFLYAEVSMLRRVDELQRKIQLEALAIAYPLAIGLLMTLGMLQRTMTLPTAALNYRHVWPMLVLFYFGGIGIAARRYR